jgi:hypothetical protein
MGAASTEVVVDTPRTAILDLRQGTWDLHSLNNRALLVGNVMASLPVREYVSRRVHVSPDVIHVAPPVTPGFPRPLSQTGNGKHATDLLRSADQYRLSIEADPTVPVLYIHAQAPSAKAAAGLANASVDGLHDYLAAVAASERVAPGQQVQVKQLGRARGGVINAGAGLQIALLVFLGVFSASFGVMWFVSRRKQRSSADERLEPDLPLANDRKEGLLADERREPVLASASRREQRSSADERLEPDLPLANGRSQRSGADERLEPDLLLTNGRKQRLSADERLDVPLANGRKPRSPADEQLEPQLPSGQRAEPGARPHEEGDPVGTWLDFGSAGEPDR